MVSHSTEAMMVVDRCGVIEAVSARGARLLGFEDKELLGISVDRLTETLSPLEFSLRLQDLRKHTPKPALSEFRVRTRGGTLQWMTVEVNLVGMGTQAEKYLVKLQKLDLPRSKPARGDKPV